MLIFLHAILDIYFGFVLIKCKFLYIPKLCHEVRNPWYSCCFDKFVAWLTRYGGVSDSHLVLKISIDFRLHWAWLAWIANWMGWKFHGKGYQSMGRQVRGLQSAWAHTKCADCSTSARDAKCADVREMRGPRFNCAGRTECAGPALAMQCPRNATVVPLAWAAMSRNRPAH